VVAQAGGVQKASATLRTLERKLPDLAKHVRWKGECRKYVKDEQHKAKTVTTTVWLELDYGAEQDSRGRKVNQYTACVVYMGELEYFDFFFDAANQHAPGAGHKKDGEAGMFFMRQLFDPAHAPTGCKGKSLFASHFPSVTQVFLTGDTGNGFRAYLMLRFLSNSLVEFRLLITLVPLGPGHAFNKSDAHIARTHEFFVAVKLVTLLFGAEQMAAAREAVTRPSTERRKYVARTHVFFRVVPKAVQPKTQSRSLLDDLGVRAFAFFQFWFTNSDGVRYCEEDCCLVRQHADPNTLDNPTRVFCWDKAKAKVLCQTCSDHKVRPIWKRYCECGSKARRGAPKPTMPMVHKAVKGNAPGVSETPATKKRKAPTDEGKALAAKKPKQRQEIEEEETSEEETEDEEEEEGEDLEGELSRGGGRGGGG
jgi:hypothetical protein